VLIGEATHGTHEFYRIRADLTRALIQRRGFTIVAAEADWPDAYRAHRWVRGAGEDQTAEEALSDFTRFPRWMWRNREVVRFLRWLRAENAGRAMDDRVGFYGLDLYSLHRSMSRVIEYLDKVDPAAAARARQGYACFDVFGDDVQSYGYAASLNLARSCEDDVVQQLVDLRRRAAEYAARDGRIAADEYFAAEQNARVVCDAEAYYRAMFRGGAESWNLRDRHMMATLEALLEHAARQGRAARAVVWAHNSHLGDARATSLSQLGELNLGQLAKERIGKACCAIGMTTHDGEVTAAHEWEEPAALRSIRVSAPGSYERLFHDTGLDAFVLRLSTPDLAGALAGPRLERAIGVLYRPGDRARQPLLLGAAAGTVRSRRARRPHPRAGTAREVEPPRGGPPGDLPDWSVIMPTHTTTWTRPVQFRAGEALIPGDLTIPVQASGLVVFAHGSGSSRFSTRNRAVAGTLVKGGFATLLLDLLTREEEAVDLRTREYRFDIDRLSHRVVAAIDWAGGQPDLASLQDRLLRREHGRRGRADRGGRSPQGRPRRHLSRRPAGSGGGRVATRSGANPAHRGRRRRRGHPAQSGGHGAHAGARGAGDRTGCDAPVRRTRSARGGLAARGGVVRAIPSWGMIMALREVPQSEWRAFLAEFSRGHAAWLGTVSGLVAGTPVTHIDSVPLKSVTLESDPSGSVLRMTFMNGISLCAVQPSRLRVQTDDGAERALEVETAEGGLMRLAFRAVALPEQLDGVAPGEVADAPDERRFTT
jgi:erythromycin esterase-like protein